MKLNNSTFRISLDDLHLTDFSYDYYLELGLINIEPLKELFDGKSIPLKQIIQKNIFQDGTGRITGGTDDLRLQFYLLNHLLMENSTNIICLTYGCCKYYDENHVECSAPILIFPVTLNNDDGTFRFTSLPLINRALIKRLRELSYVNNYLENRINHLINNSLFDSYDIDYIIMEFKRLTSTELYLNSYITTAKIDFGTTPIKKNVFKKNVALSECSDKVLIDNFYKKIKFITPLNIKQKLALLKAHNGDSIIVTGRVGTGKTTTALNIIADALLNNKKVLYVNNSVNELVRMLFKLEDINVQDVNNDYLNFDYHDYLNKIDNLEKLYDKSLYGYPIKYILEKLFIYQSKGIDGNIDIEYELDRFEIDQISKYLRRIEVLLQNCPNYKDNVWRTIKYSGDSISQIISKTNHFYNVNQELQEVVNKITANNSTIAIENVNTLSKILPSLDVLNNVSVDYSWCDKERYQTLINNVERIEQLYLENVNFTNYVGQKLIQYNKLDTIASVYQSLVDITNNEKLNLDSIFEITLGTDLNKDLKPNLNYFYDSFNYFKKVFNLTELDNESVQFVLNFLNFLSKNEMSVDLIKTIKFNEANNKLIKQHLTNIYNDLNQIKNKLNLNITCIDLLDISNKKQLQMFLSNKEKYDKKTISTVNSLVLSLFKNVKSLKSLLNTKSNSIINNLIVNYEKNTEFISLLTTKYRSLFQSFVTYSSNKKFSSQTFTKLGYNFIKSYNYLLNVCSVYQKVSNIVISDNIKCFTLIKEKADSLIKIHSAKNDIKVLFRNSEDLTASDISDILLRYEQFKDNEEEIKTIRLTMDNYTKNKNSDTNIFIRDWHLAIHSFNYLKATFKNEENLFKFLNSLDNDLKDDYTKLQKVFAQWYNALREFSLLFGSSLIYLQSYNFDGVSLFIRDYIEQKESIKYIYQINEAINSIRKFKLNNLINDIINGNVTTNLAEEFICSCLKKLFKQLDFNNEVFDIKKHNEYINELNNYETNLSKVNINKLIASNKLDFNHNFEKANLSIKYNLYLSTLINSSTIKNLNQFDLVIVDNAEMEAASYYAPYLKAKQIILIGDSTFRLSSSNGILQILGQQHSINLNKNYLNINFDSGLNNINFDLTNKVKANYIIHEESINNFAIKVYNKYIETNAKINICVDNYEDSVMIYKIIINNLLKDYSIQDVISILIKDIKIVLPLTDVIGSADYSFVWCNKLIKMDDTYKHQFINNISLCNNLEVYTSNFELIQNFAQFRAYNHKPYLVESVSKYLSTYLKNNGLTIIPGNSFIDFFILNNSENIGIIIYGKREASNYSLIDDVTYYKNFYISQGIKILEFTVDDFILNYEQVINRIKNI